MLLASALTALRTVANRYTSSPLPAWDVFSRSVRIVHYPARSPVEQSPHDILIVLKGLVKEVHETPGIEGQISDFFVSGSVIATRLEPHWARTRSAPFSVAKLFGQRELIPPMSAYAIEATTALRIDYRVVRQLSALHPQWGEVQTAFLWTYIEEQYSTILNLRGKDTAQRYRSLMQRRGIPRRVSQRDVAAYLGITESALSRLLRRIAGESGDTGPEAISRAE